jgi:nitric oxide reductase NorD protein
VPGRFGGYSGAAAIKLYRAALAHIAAHLMFGGARFPVGGLKPVQIALVSLIEDARVEALAMRALPGLQLLWQPFHAASPARVTTAPALFARLAHALMDADYEDANAWVGKGRTLFAQGRGRLTDPQLSREIGGLLGNDLGQMRVQFNAKTYVVEPAYRDDNLGLWDFGDDAASSEDAESIPEAIRFDAVSADQPHHRERQQAEQREDAAQRARDAAAAEDAGIAVARYPEWDYAVARERADWTTLMEYDAPRGAIAAIDRILERHPAIVHRIAALVRSVKIGRPVRLRRQLEGDRLDFDACIDAAITSRLGRTPDGRVYARQVRRHRDLSALILLDVSQSTNDRIAGGPAIIELERAATALLAHALDGLGDPFAVHAFCSNGRDDVRYFRIKEFGLPYGEAAKRRLAGLSGQLSTRLGAALRHAGCALSQQLTHRRLLLVLSDGEPSDIDVGDRRYLVEDARKAVQSLAHRGLDVFCVGLDAGGDSYLAHIFGRRNVLLIDRLERLPEKLTALYFRLTG